MGIDSSIGLLDTRTFDKKPKQLPDQVIQDAADLNFERAALLYDDKEGKIYQLHADVERIPIIGKMDFVMFYQYDNERSLQSFSFLYADSKTDERTARFTIDRISPTHFSLVHRLVEPEQRGQGIGSKLLRRVENFLQQLADHLQETVTLDIQIAQRNVMAWAVNNSYEPDNLTDEELVAEIFEHPEHFQFQSLGHDTEFQDDYMREDYVFRPETTERNSKTAVRVPFIKKFEPKNGENLQKLEY